MSETTFHTVVELSRALAARKVSAEELAREYLGRIEKHKDLNCFLDVRQGYFRHSQMGINSSQQNA